MGVEALTHVNSRTKLEFTSPKPLQKLKRAIKNVPDTNIISFSTKTTKSHSFPSEIIQETQSKRFQWVSEFTCCVSNDLCCQENLTRLSIVTHSPLHMSMYFSAYGIWKVVYFTWAALHFDNWRCPKSWTRVWQFSSRIFVLRFHNRNTSQRRRQRSPFIL